MSDTESQLAARTAKGDLTALELIYRRHVPAVWQYAWSQTRSRESAADIVQETFLRIARGVKKFEGRSAFATWLYRVARSATIDHARRRRREQKERTDEGVLRLVPAPGDSDSDDARTLEQTAVRDAISKLPGAQRDAIVLYEISGLTIDETAEVLNWKQSRERVTLHRARRKLRILLEAYVKQEEKDAAHDRG